jgi:hypothetical protein
MDKTLLKINEDIDKSYDAISKKIDKLYLKFFSKYPQLINNKSNIDLIVAARISDEAKVLVNELGLTDILNDYAKYYKKVYNTTLSYYSSKDLDDKLNAKHKEMLNIAISRSVEELEKTVDNTLLKPFDNLLFNSVIANNTDATSLSQLAIEQISNISTRQVQVEVDRAYTIFTNTVSKLKADELDLQFVQINAVIDSKTTDVCRDLATQVISRTGVPGLFYVDEVTQDIHEGCQFADPLINNQHYNCRSRWSYVTKEYAIDQGAIIDED